MGTTLTAPELLITRVFDAPRELVFRLWTDPAHAVRWWGPKHHPATQVTMDSRPGGAWRSCLRSTETGQELWNGGVLREIVPPSRLVFTFMWDDMDGPPLESVVTVTFADQDGKTLMQFHQSPFRSTESRDGHNEGWSSSFDRFEKYLAAA